MTSDGYWVRFSRVPERSLNCLPQAAAAEPAIALGSALRSLRHGLRSTFQAPHLRPPLFVRGGPIPDQVPSAKGSGASPDRTDQRALDALDQGGDDLGLRAHHAPP